MTSSSVLPTYSDNNVFPQKPYIETTYGEDVNRSITSASLRCRSKFRVSYLCSAFIIFNTARVSDPSPSVLLTYLFSPPAPTLQTCLHNPLPIYPALLASSTSSAVRSVPDFPSNAIPIPDSRGRVTPRIPRPRPRLCRSMISFRSTECISLQFGNDFVCQSGFTHCSLPISSDAPDPFDRLWRFPSFVYPSISPSGLISVSGTVPNAAFASSILNFLTLSALRAASRFARISSLSLCSGRGRSNGSYELSS
mmetsp:Transcript_7565/g.11321  ORF Transcript_7565/g.11321 Transcript_7565/m.11321 type:complete len:252 (+) Transcript_7565:848-1603(+)